MRKGKRAQSRKRENRMIDQRQGAEKVSATYVGNTYNAELDSNISKSFFLKAVDPAAKELTSSFPEIKRVALVTKLHKKDKRKLKIFELENIRSSLKKFSKQISKTIDLLSYIAEWQKYKKAFDKYQSLIAEVLSDLQNNESIEKLDSVIAGVKASSAYETALALVLADFYDDQKIVKDLRHLGSDCDNSVFIEHGVVLLSTVAASIDNMPQECMQGDNQSTRERIRISRVSITIPSAINFDELNDLFKQQLGLPSDINVDELNDGFKQQLGKQQYFKKGGFMTELHNLKDILKSVTIVAQLTTPTNQINIVLQEVLKTSSTEESDNTHPLGSQLFQPGPQVHRSGRKNINDAPLVFGISNAVEVFLFNSSQSVRMQGNDREAGSLRLVHLELLRTSVYHKYRVPSDFDLMLRKDIGTLQNVQIRTRRNFQMGTRRNVQKGKYPMQTKNGKTSSSGSVEFNDARSKLSDFEMLTFVSDESEEAKNIQKSNISEHQPI